MEPHYGWPKLSDFKITIISTILINLAEKFMKLFTWRYFYAVCKEKHDLVVRYDKTVKACHSFFDMFYYTLMGIWGYIVLKDAYYLPHYLGGAGDMDLSTQDYPIHPWPNGFKLYFLSSLGYHVHSLIAHLRAKKRNDFIEMFLHHNLAIFLMIFSYLANFTVAGSIICFLHDIADIFTAGVRCFTETTLLTPTIINGVGMTISWFYTRIYAFPFVIYKTAFKHDYFEG